MLPQRTTTHYFLRPQQRRNKKMKKQHSTPAAFRLDVDKPWLSIRRDRKKTGQCRRLATTVLPVSYKRQRRLVPPPTTSPLLLYPRRLLRGMASHRSADWDSAFGIRQILRPLGFGHGRFYQAYQSSPTDQLPHTQQRGSKTTPSKTQLQSMELNTVNTMNKHKHGERFDHKFQI